MNKVPALQLIRLDQTAKRAELLLSSGGLGSATLSKQSDKFAIVTLTNPPPLSELDFKVGDYYEITIKRVEAPNKEKTND